MPNLVRARSWGQVKPPPGAQIDWGHPLAQRLVFAAPLFVAGGAAIDLVTGSVATPTGAPTWDYRNWGGRDYYRGADDSTPGDEWVAQEGPFRQISLNGLTFLATVTQLATSGDFDGLIGVATADGATWHVGIQCTSGGAPEIWVNNAELKALSTTVAASDIPYTFVSRHNAVDQNLGRYIGGSAAPDQITSGTATPFATPTWAATNKIVLGNARVAVRNWKGVIHKGYAWARMLTDDEIAWLQAEPYAFIARPGPQILYIGPFSSGAVVNALTVDGTITPTGALTKADQKAVAGTITPAGALAKADTKALAGALTPAGSTARATGKGLAGGLVPVGSPQFQQGKGLAGQITPSGVLARALGKGFSGSVTPSGVVTRQIGKGLAGSIVPAGGLAKRVNKLLVGVLTFVGDVILAPPAPPDIGHGRARVGSRPDARTHISVRPGTTP